MDIASLSQVNTQSSLQQQVGNKVLRKALDIQASSAQQLIESVPTLPKPAPGGAAQGSLGTQLDTYA